MKKLNEPWAIIIAALIGLVGVLVAGYFVMKGAQEPFRLSLQATQTAKANLTMGTPNTESTDVAMSGTTSTSPSPEPPSGIVTREIGDNPPPGKILLEEDFEDKKAVGFTSAYGKWKFVVDETGNVVYETDNSKEMSLYSEVIFGDENWQDYAVEYRVRMLNFNATSPQIHLAFRRNFIDGEKFYVQAFLTYYEEIIIAFSEDGGPWTRLSTLGFNFSPGVWYTIRVEAYGEEIRVFVDDQLIIDITDSRIDRGALKLSVGPQTHAQFDEIRVIALGN